MASEVQDNLARIQQSIRQAEQKYQRESCSVTLLAVSKTKPVEMIQQAYDAGQTCFGENYLQDAINKIEHFKQIHIPIEWHFIGYIQSNKTKLIAQNFAWVHTIDRLKIALHLNQKRPSGLPPLNICLQVNIDHSATKSGLLAEECDLIMPQLMVLKNIRVRGLMAIPDPSDSFDQQRQKFHEVKQLFDSLKTKYNDMPFDTLSMGMSGDLTAAIAAGTTMVRIGTDVFGARQK